MAEHLKVQSEEQNGREAKVYYIILLIKFSSILFSSITRIGGHSIIPFSANC
jgi:hypothetical protein